MEIFLWSEIIAIVGLVIGLIVSRGERRKRILRLTSMVLSVYGGLQYMLIGAIGSLGLLVAYFVIGAFGGTEKVSLMWVVVATGVFVSGIVGISGAFLARRWPERGAKRMFGAAGYYIVAAIAFAVSFLQEQIRIETVRMWAILCFPAVLLALAGVAAQAADRIVVVATSSVPEID